MPAHGPCSVPALQRAAGGAFALYATPPPRRSYRRRCPRSAGSSPRPDCPRPSSPGRSPRANSSRYGPGEHASMILYCSSGLRLCSRFRDCDHVDLAAAGRKRARIRAARAEEDQFGDVAEIEANATPVRAAVLADLLNRIFSLKSQVSASMDLVKSEQAYESGSRAPALGPSDGFGARCIVRTAGVPSLSSFPPNSPVADFFCAGCQEQYELKVRRMLLARRCSTGRSERCVSASPPATIPASFYSTTISRGWRSPTWFWSLSSFSFARSSKSVSRFSHRTARWLGGLLFVSQIPAVGKIFLVRNGEEQPRKSVLSQWRRTLFLEKKSRKPGGG